MANPASIAHGPGLAGTFLNIILYGIMVTQSYLYFSVYKDDKLWLKLLVIGLFIADTLNCVFDMWWIYDVLINHFDDINALNTGNWVFATDPAMVGIIATTVQLFFAWRVHILLGKRWIVGIIVVSALGSIFGGIGTAIAIHIVPEFTEFQKFKIIVIIWLILAAICDITITVSLTWHLHTHKTGFTTTDDLLNKIIRLTMQNGSLTALWALVDLIVFLTSSTGLHLVFNFPLAKLYTNSLLSSLNSRRRWHYTSESFRSESTPANPSRNTHSRKRGDIVNLSTQPNPEVFVNVETHEMVDVVDKNNIGELDWAGSLTQSQGEMDRKDTAWAVRHGDSIQEVV